MQRLGGLVIRDKHERRRLSGLHEIGKIESPRSRGEPGHTSPARAAREMATHTLKDWRSFKVRDQLADERKNHAVSSLALRLYPGERRAQAYASSGFSPFARIACPYSSRVTMKTPPHTFPATAIQSQ